MNSPYRCMPSQAFESISRAFRCSQPDPERKISKIASLIRIVLKGELVESTGIGNCGSGSNLKEKGLTIVLPGSAVVVLDLMRLRRLDPQEYLEYFERQGPALGCGVQLFPMVSCLVLFTISDAHAPVNIFVLVDFA
jgi:hypothetical protein